MSVALLSKLPDSPLGRRVTHELESYGVDVQASWDEAARQGAYYIEHGAGPRPMAVIYDVLIQR